MPCFLNDPQVAYFPVPKCGCTTIKYVFYQVENKKKFELFVINGQKKHIHTLYRSEPFRKDYYKQFESYAKVAIIRDPLKRLLSAYCNRVLRYKELGSKADPSSSKMGKLPVEPNIEEFARYLKYYIKHSPSIAHHLAPFTHYMGNDLKWYDHVLKFEDFEGVKATISSLFGRTLEFPDIQKSPAVIAADQLSLSARDIFLRFLKADYRYLKDYYSV